MERIAFGAGLMKQSGVYLSTVYDGSTQKVTLTDEFGEAEVYLLPFVRPSIVRRALGQEEIESYQDAVFAAVNHMDIDTKKRNIFGGTSICYGCRRCDSEDIVVGGVDNIDASIFEAFDYTALGHIHSPQNIKEKCALLRNFIKIFSFRGRTGKISYCYRDGKKE